MERTMSVEEKIRRAEEIYARRHEQDTRSTATLYLQGNGKKDIKLFKKLILQIVVCLLIYLVVYTIRNNDYIFSEDFISKAREYLTEDTNFIELYENFNKAITSFFDNNDNVKDEEQNNEEDNKQIEENIGGKNEEAETIEVNNNEANIEEETKENEEVAISEEEQKILDVKNTTTFIKPVEGIISSPYGFRNPTTSTVPKNHTGTDIAANLGTKIVSSTDGEVVIVSSEGDYGNHIKIQIGNVSIIYAHCNKIYVNQGDKVKQGQEIAEVGSTGNSTGPHLHFEIRINEETVDPERILDLK